MSGYYFPIVGGGRITSNVGSRGGRQHEGVDIAGARGLPVVATSDQRVTKSYLSESYGNVVYTRDAQNREFRYAHLDNRNVSAGATLVGGQQLGTVGNTGKSRGNHLHYEVRDAYGKVQNAANYLGGTLDKAKGLVRKGIDIAAASGNPFAIAAQQGMSIAGIGGDDSCAPWDIFCPFKKWIVKSEFFQRAAIVILALVFIGAAFALFAKGQQSKVLSQVMKG